MCTRTDLLRVEARRLAADRRSSAVEDERRDRRRTPASDKRGETFRDVGVAGVEAAHLLERARGPRGTSPARSSRSASAYQRRTMCSCTRPLSSRAPFEQVDRVGQPARVGERAGEHDAAFGHERRRRRRLAQLFPELLDVAEPALRAPAVHEHGMLLGRAGQVDERSQVVGRGRRRSRCGTGTGPRARAPRPPSDTRR